jgi:hypothetical protein
MKGIREVLVGVVLVVMSFAGTWYFRLLDEIRDVLLGVIPLVILFFGALFLMIGVSTMRMKSPEIESWDAESGEEKSE